MKTKEIIQIFLFVVCLSTTSIAKPVDSIHSKEKTDSDDPDPALHGIENPHNDAPEDEEIPLNADGIGKLGDFEMNEKDGSIDNEAKPIVDDTQIKTKDEKQQDLHHDLKLIGEQASKGERLSHADLVPADHLDVVKMEADGHVNQQYHKEMFLGEGHEEFKSESVDEAKVKLKDIFDRADTDKDEILSRGEIKDWIQDKMKDHFDMAKDDNAHIFKHLDPDQDGVIKWKEYYLHFLLSRGFDTEKSVQHVKDYDESVKLGDEDKDALVNYKFKWMDADLNSDNELTEAEFMAFRHPEHSKKTLETMGRNIFRSVDTNEDGIITEEEFIALPPGEVETEEFREMDRKWQRERSKEFKEFFDENKDGKVDFKEVLNYLDPKNPQQAALEADNLISLMDDSEDGRLTMDEIEHHSDIFISSKIVNFAASLHDEF